MKRLLITLILLVLFAADAAVAAITLKYSINGVSGEMLSNINSRLENQKLSLPELNAKTIAGFDKHAPEQIKKALEPFGYFRAEVGAALTHEKDKWLARYNVRLGQPLRIKSLNFTVTGPGATNAEFRHTLEQLPLKTGEIFQATRYNNAKQFLFSTAADFGYLTAILVTKEIKIDLKNYYAAVTLNFNTGPQYYFGPIIFSRTPLSEQFLQKFVHFKQGETYRAKKIQALQDDLNNSNFFQQVVVLPKIPKDNSVTVPINAHLTPRKFKQYNLGIGYGTDTGARGSIGIERRYITSNGQSFKGLLQLSEVQNNLAAHYLIPGRVPNRDQYDISLLGQTIRNNYGKGSSGQIGVGYITTLLGWQQTLKLGLQREYYKLTDQTSVITTFFLPSANWSRLRSDDPVKPSKGHNINIMLQGSNHWLLAKNSFLQALVDGKYLTTLKRDNQLLLHGTLGYSAVSDIKALPLSLAIQYSAGGTQSVRGYSYQSIGPGKNLTVGSAEVRRRVYGDWYVAAFVDAGSADDRLFSHLKRGVGGGVVWRSPIGAIEITYAKALDLKGRPGKIQFSMGPEL